jgi:hypothetical protein
MTSSFADRWPPAVVGAILALTGGACRGQPSDDTMVDVLRTTSALCAGPGQTDLSTTPMDTYAIELYSVNLAVFPVNVGEASISQCETCVANAGRDATDPCIPEKMICICSAPLTPSRNNLAAMLKGTRLPGLDSTDIYCMRVLAIERGAAASAPTESCDCNPAWTTPDALASTARLCALSVPRPVGPVDIELEVRCPSDDSPGFGGRGGGFGQPTGQLESFSDCIAPPKM